MSLLVLSEADVRAVLDMESCIEAMEEALAALARDELEMPLRSVFRSSANAFFGLMPAYRGGAAPTFALKEIVVVPDNATRGLDSHQGAVLLHDGTTGVLRAVVDASAITEIRTAAVSAVATKLLARPGARRVAILGSGVQGRSHAHAMRVVVPDAELRVWSRTPAHAEALALESHALACATVEEALEGAEIVCTCTSAAEPIVRRSWLADGAHVNAAGGFGPNAELDAEVVADATLFADRRESLLGESGDWLNAVRQLGLEPDHVRAELGDVLVGRHPGRTGVSELTLFESMGLAVEDLAAAVLCVERARERGLGSEVPF